MGRRGGFKVVTPSLSIVHAQTWHGVAYSQVDLYKGYRKDCSGFVSMCWELPPPGESTVTLVTHGWMYEIEWSQLLPGDAIGICGPGTEGDNGHIQLVFQIYRGTNRVAVYEQTPPSGAQFNTYDIKERQRSGYRPYRFYYMEESPHVITDEDVKRIAEYVYVSAPDFPNPYGYNNSAVGQGTNNAAWMCVGMLNGIIETLKNVDGIDATAVQAAVEKGVADALAHIRVVVDASP